MERTGRNGKVPSGLDGRGEAGEERLGVARWGNVSAGMDRRGRVRFGTARIGEAGEVRLGRDG
jgi:hypothetical protein